MTPQNTKFMQWNKRGESPGIWTIIFILLIFSPFFILFPFVFLQISYIDDVIELKDDACKKLSFKEYVSGEVSMCRDRKGNLHYIEMDCGEYIFKPKRCFAKEISVGGVRVVE